MTLPNGFEADLASCLGDRRVAKKVVTALNDAGADGSGSFTSVTAGTVAATTSVSAATFTGTGATQVFQTNAGAADWFVQSGGSAVIMTLNGDAEHAFTLTVTDSAVAWNVVSDTSGECVMNLADNQADAFSIKIVSGNDFLVFQSTDSAEAVLIANNLASTPPANQTLTNGATITLPAGCVKVVDNGGAVTGIILTAGVVDGQILHIVNAAAASVTFATGATSNVADGTSAVIAANRAISLIWDSGSSRWYRTG